MIRKWSILNRFYSQMGACLPTENQLNGSGQFDFLTGTHPGVRCPRSETSRAKGNTIQVPAILQGEAITRLLQGAFVGFAATADRIADRGTVISFMGGEPVYIVVNEQP
jgi:hypothetical protein